MTVKVNVARSPEEAELQAQGIDVMASMFEREEAGFTEEFDPNAEPGEVPAEPAAEVRLPPPKLKPPPRPKPAKPKARAKKPKLPSFDAKIEPPGSRPAAFSLADVRLVAFAIPVSDAEWRIIGQPRSSASRLVLNSSHSLGRAWNAAALPPVIDAMSAGSV